MISEIFVEFVFTGILIVEQFLVIDSHLDSIEKKIDKLKGDKNE